MVRGKRGVGGAKDVAILVAVIGLLMIVYVLLLPPSEREDLLNITDGDSDINGDTNGDKGDYYKTLLLERPGTVYPFEEDEAKHDINQVNIFVRTEPEMINLPDYLTISISSFSRQDQNLFFSVENLKNLKKVVLNFNVKNSIGILKIELNGNKIFEGGINTGTRLVNLPTHYLRSNNELKFSLSSPGILFWKENIYVLEDIRVKQEFERINPREVRTFIVNGDEYDALEKSKLNYNIYCNSLKTDNTLFKIYLNDEVLSSEAIACTAGSKTIEIDEDIIEEGNNELTFVIEDGDFLINNIEVMNELSEKTYKTYYFSIDSDDYEDVIGEEKDVILKMSFSGENKRKAKIVLNDYDLHIDTMDDTYSKDISDLVDRDENIITIIPDEEFEIDSLRVAIQD